MGNHEDKTAQDGHKPRVDPAKIVKPSSKGGKHEDKGGKGDGK